MTTVLLIRHAVNDFVKTGKLAGWTPEVHLNEDGLAQAAALGERLADAPLRALYSSPLERAIETAEAVQKYHPKLPIQLNEGVKEMNYGEWQGMALSDLRRRKLWSVVQQTPSRVTFPGGEAFVAAQTRAVQAIEQAVLKHPAQLIAFFSHSDMIKMILTYYMGSPLDSFQRLDIATASVSTVQLGHSSPYILSVNDVSHLRSLKRENKG